MTKSLDKRKIPREVRAAVKAALDRKAENTLVLDLRELSDFTDFFVITQGQSSRQNAAVADGVVDALKAEHVRPLGVEGLEKAEWVLIDYGWFVIHVFSPRIREHFALEKLWGDAPRAEY